MATSTRATNDESDTLRCCRLSNINSDAIVRAGLSANSWRYPVRFCTSHPPKSFEDRGPTTGEKCARCTEDLIRGEALVVEWVDSGHATPINTPASKVCSRSCADSIMDQLFANVRRAVDGGMSASGFGTQPPPPPPPPSPSSSPSLPKPIHDPTPAGTRDADHDTKVDAKVEVEVEIEDSTIGGCPCGDDEDVPRLTVHSMDGTQLVYSSCVACDQACAHESSPARRRLPVRSYANHTPVVCQNAVCGKMTRPGSWNWVQLGNAWDNLRFMTCSGDCTTELVEALCAEHGPRLRSELRRRELERSEDAIAREGALRGVKRRRTSPAAGSASALATFAPASDLAMPASASAPASAAGTNSVSTSSPTAVEAELTAAPGAARMGMFDPDDVSLGESYQSRHGGSYGPWRPPYESYGSEVASAA